MSHPKIFKPEDLSYMQLNKIHILNKYTFFIPDLINLQFACIIIIIYVYNNYYNIIIIILKYNYNIISFLLIL